MRMRICISMPLLLLLVPCLGCASNNVAQTDVKSTASNVQPSRDADSSPPLVSIVSLIAAPDRFNGKRIQVIGFTHFEFEGNAVYLSREDYRYGLDKNGIWLSMNKSHIDKQKELNDSYVIVEGTFNAEHKGHFGFFSGSIENITLLKRWAKVGAKMTN
jgi:hypothetical protein